MGVTIHVNGRSNSLAHKGCMGITKSTLPDVCKTPSPGGPVPVPYPIIVSLSGSLSKGTKSVKVDGGNSAAIKGSEYGRCSGDEPGTAGGVKSSTNMKEATWISYSFDVKLEGKNACRLADKMMMNHGNTACMAGTIHRPVLAGQLYSDQTCTDARRQQIHDQQEWIKQNTPGGNLKGLGAKRLGRLNINCSVMIARIKRQNQLLRTRLKMQNECFQQSPIAGDADSAERHRVHQLAIQDTRNAIARSKQVAAMKCAPGCPTMDL